MVYLGGTRGAERERKRLIYEGDTGRGQLLSISQDEGKLIARWKWMDRYAKRA